MERSKLIQLLVREGMTEKTLANFSDRQISLLANRMLGEQVSPMVSKPSFKVGPKGGSVPPSPKGYSVRKDPTDPNSTILQPQESELKEKLVGGQKKLDKNKNGKLDSEDFKMLRAKKDISEKTKPSAGLSKEKKSEVAKKAIAGKDIGKKGKGFKEVEKKAKESGAKNPKAVAAAAMWKNIPRESKLKEDTVVKNWLMQLVESEYHPLTSKGEIMDLIKSKTQNRRRLNEFNTFMNSPQPEVDEPDIDVEPDVDTPPTPSRPPRPRPRNPEDPNPGPLPDIKNKSGVMPDFLSYDALKDAVSGEPEVDEPDIDVEPDVDTPPTPSRPPRPRPRNPEDPNPGPLPDIKNKFKNNY